MKVLIVKTSSMGDMLHTLPALTDAVNAIPNIEFDWVAEEAFIEIPTWHNAVKNVIPIAIRRWRKNWFSKQNRQERKQYVATLKSKRYDAIIDAQALIKSALFVCAKAKGECHGYDFKSVREFPACFFYNKRHFVPQYMHAVERMRLLFAKSLNYEVRDLQGNYDIAKNFNHKLTNNEAPYLYFAHSTTADAKHWSESYWIDLITMCKPLVLKIKLPWGNEQERQRSLRLAKDFDYVEVLPKLPIAKQAEIITNSVAVVAVDTGLSHLSAALDHKCVALYGPTDVKLIGTYGKNQVRITGKNKSINNIKALQVYEKLIELIK